MKSSFSLKWGQQEELLLATLWWIGHTTNIICFDTHPTWMVQICNHTLLMDWLLINYSFITYPFASAMLTTAMTKNMFTIKYKVKLSWLGVCWLAATTVVSTLFNLFFRFWMIGTKIWQTRIGIKRPISVVNFLSNSS